MTSTHHPLPRTLIADYRKFVTAAVRRPAQVGAVIPSSAALARVMANIVPTSGTPTVVELGPGTGALSAAIRQRLPEGGRHLAIELDADMAEHLRTTLPGSEVIEGDAAELGTVLAEAGVGAADAVVSGLPWSLFSAESQSRILHQVGESLAHGAAFTTIAYLHALGMRGARQFRARLDEAFDEVVMTRTVWRNLPPARIYVCRRPKIG